MTAALNSKAVSGDAPAFDESTSENFSQSCFRNGVVAGASAATHRGRMKITTWQERFWRYLTPGAPDECWEWTGSRDQNGYGRLQRDRGTGHIKAHRASYELHTGEAPGAFSVCHRCDNPPCVNPAHLFLGTQKDNADDMVAKGRAGARFGADNVRTRLSDSDVVAIRERAAAGDAYDTLATAYGVATTHISAIVTGERRANVGGPITRRSPRNEITALVLERIRAATRPLAASELGADLTGHQARQALNRLRARGVVGRIDGVTGRGRNHRYYLIEEQAA